MENITDQAEINIAVQALWLQYLGLTFEAVRTRNHVQNAAWKTSPPPPLEDMPAIGGLMVAT
jgi:hypothetical protein